MRNLFSAFAIIMSFAAFAQTSGSKWKLHYVRYLDKMESVTNRKGDILLSIEEQKLSGTVGCNQFTGTIDYIKNNQIKPVKLVNKKEGCASPEDKLDKAVVDALNTANKLLVTADRAKFYKGEQLVLELKR